MKITLACSIDGKYRGGAVYEIDRVELREIAKAFLDAADNPKTENALILFCDMPLGFLFGTEELAQDYRALIERAATKVPLQ